MFQHRGAILRDSFRSEEHSPALQFRYASLVGGVVCYTFRLDEISSDRNDRDSCLYVCCTQIMLCFHNIVILCLRILCILEFLYFNKSSSGGAYLD